MNTSILLELLSHTALKGAVVLLVALLLGLGLRRMAAARRYAIWITAIATLAVLPLAMWALPAWHVLPQTDGALEWPVMEPPLVIDPASSFLPPEDDSSGWHASTPALHVPAQAPARPVFSWTISWQDVVELLPMVWMLVASLLLLRLGHSAWRLHRLAASLRPGECVLVPQTARELGLRRMPRLLIGPSDSVPMVWGVLRPRLLLPQGFETWSPEKQRSVLLHELAHLKRGDPLALWISQWVKALHWFNPLVWLTLRQLRADQERACDDAVLRRGVRASDYAQSLLDLSRHNRLAPGLSLCALTITRCAPVEARVKAILDPSRRRESLSLRWLAGLAGGALLITLPVAMLHAIESPMLRGRILDRHGVVLAESTREKVRNYPLKTLAAHMTGYTRAPDETHAQIHGGAALEKQHDAELTAGKDVTLTLDMRIQSLAYRALKEAGVTRGAAVVLDPRTGEILAAVSLPSFDPNLFIPSITRENWEKYLSNRDVPLLDRCVKGHIPGSAYKLLTGLAGCAAGTSGQKFNCTGTVTYGSKVMQCWKYGQDGGGHGMLGMSEALAVSCNCYWYQFGNATGIEQIESMGRKIGFGSAYGITDEEDPGILPSPSWLVQNRPQEQWSDGYTANVSIGSGFVLATPLQMAVLAATVGNGGKVPQPGLVKQDGESKWRVDLTQETLTAANVDQLREGMRLAVNGESGTGRPARSGQVMIAGKTGTAQAWRLDPNGTKQDDNQGWFIGFAPFDKPTLAFAILKQGAKSGGGDCGPIAKRIVEETLALPADGSGEVQPVEDKSVAAPAKFDFDAGETSRQIKLLEAELKIYLKEFKIGNGRVAIVGEATELENALQWRKRLEEIGEKRQIAWFFPLPKSLANGRVGFEANGIYQPSKSNTEEGGKNTEGAPGPFQILRQKAAKVIGRSSSTSAKSLVIAKGSLDGIVANCPVITSAGLVGKTGTPEAYFTEVILLTDARCQVSAKVEGTMERGILNGDKEANERGAPLHLRFLNRDAKINIGSSVYSSGEGGVFPAGLRLGRVKDFKRGDVSGEAVVDPVVDFSTLDQVFVIEPKAEPSEQKTPSPPKPAGQAQSDGEIRMQKAMAYQWSVLKRVGMLADLPAEAKPLSGIQSGGDSSFVSVREFRFHAPREAVRRWLLVCHCQSKWSQPWPEPPAAFQHAYTAAGDCSVWVHSPDGRTVYVTVSKRHRPIYIAPDESRQPRPAGRLEPDHKKDGLAQRETALPALDVAPQSLAPTISADVKPRRPFFQPAPGNLRLRASAAPENPKLERPAVLIQLREEFSSDAEPGLLRSLQKSSRKQQTLWVKAAQS